MCSSDLFADGKQGRPEIFAYGLRNPWGISFDRGGARELFAVDVGQNLYEELNIIVKGGNYGWRCLEGTRVTNLTCGASATPATPPIAEYDHTLGVAVVGGFVYRGTAIPGLVGRFVFADEGSGRIWNIATDTQPTLTMTAADALDTAFAIASFAEDTNGELFFVDVKSGALYRLIQG